MYSCPLTDSMETSIASAPAVFPPEVGVLIKRNDSIPA